jgi:hypothetical protein
VTKSFRPQEVAPHRRSVSVRVENNYVGGCTVGRFVSWQEIPPRQSPTDVGQVELSKASQEELRLQERPQARVFLLASDEARSGEALQEWPTALYRP